MGYAQSGRDSVLSSVAGGRSSNRRRILRRRDHTSAGGCVPELSVEEPVVFRSSLTMMSMEPPPTGSAGFIRHETCLVRASSPTLEPLWDVRDSTPKT
jgi:hypothetical protein